MTDQERFNASVMNWISEATSLLHHSFRSNGGRKIMTDACMACWEAYGHDTTDHDAAPAARATTKPGGLNSGSASGASRDSSRATKPSSGTGDAQVRGALTETEREALAELLEEPDFYGLTRTHTKVFRGLLERMP